MPLTIAFVGAGPSTIYFFNKATQPAAVTIFEEQPRAGPGTPYRPGWYDPAMLSNIAGIEIPHRAALPPMQGYLPDFAITHV